MTNWEFPGSEPIEILIDITSGSIAVSAEPADVTTVRVEAKGRGGEAAAVGGQRHPQPGSPGDHRA